MFTSMKYYLTDATIHLVFISEWSTRGLRFTKRYCDRWAGRERMGYWWDYSNGDLSRIFLTSELISDIEWTGLVCSCSSPCTSLLPLPSEIFEENSGENIGEWRISRTHGNRLCWYQSVFLRTALWWVPRCSRCSSCSPQSSFPQSSPPPSSWWTVSAPLQPLPG